MTSKPNMSNSINDIDRLRKFFEDQPKVDPVRIAFCNNLSIALNHQINNVCSQTGRVLDPLLHRDYWTAPNGSRHGAGKQMTSGLVRLPNGTMVPFAIAFAMDVADVIIKQVREMTSSPSFLDEWFVDIADLQISKYKNEPSMVTVTYYLLFPLSMKPPKSISSTEPWDSKDFEFNLLEAVKKVTTSLRSSSEFFETTRLLEWCGVGSFNLMRLAQVIAKDFQPHLQEQGCTSKIVHAVNRIVGDHMIYTRVVIQLGWPLRQYVSSTATSPLAADDHKDASDPMDVEMTVGDEKEQHKQKENESGSLHVTMAASNDNKDDGENRKAIQQQNHHIYRALDLLEGVKERLTSGRFQYRETSNPIQAVTDGVSSMQLDS
jgi:hypothetical protein